MIKQIKILLSAAILILLFYSRALPQVEEQRQDTAVIQSYGEIQQPETPMKETVTISDTSAAVTTNENNPQRNGPTEKIHIYSGRHEGNNIIKTVEIRLPDNSTTRNGDYVPH